MDIWLRSTPASASSSARRAPTSQTSPSGAPPARARATRRGPAATAAPASRPTTPPLPLDRHLDRVLGRGHAGPELLDLAIQLLDLAGELADLVAGRHAQPVERGGDLLVDLLAHAAPGALRLALDVLDLLLAARLDVLAALDQPAEHLRALLLGRRQGAETRQPDAVRRLGQLVLEFPAGVWGLGIGIRVHVSHLSVLKMGPVGPAPADPLRGLLSLRSVFPASIGSPPATPHSPSHPSGGEGDAPSLSSLEGLSASPPLPSARPLGPSASPRPARAARTRWAPGPRPQGRRWGSPARLRDRRAWLRAARGGSSGSPSPRAPAAPAPAGRSRLARGGPSPAAPARRRC